MKRIAIIGAGDLGQQFFHHINTYNNYKVVGFFDDFIKPSENEYITILGTLNDIEHFYKNNVFDELLIAIGYKHLTKRAEVFNLFVNAIPFASFIHPTSYIHPSCKIGKGVFIYPGCIIDINSVIDDNVVIYNGCNISHDSTIGFNSILSPGVNISGFVQLKQNVNLGTGTIVVDNVLIEKNIRTGAGAVVTQNIVDSGIYIGCPAKLLR